MIVGIGTDIVRIARIELSLTRVGDAFAERILTANELKIWYDQPVRATYLAKRFAAKEAVAKAFGTGIGKVSFKHIEVRNNEAGAPLLTLYGYAAELKRQKMITNLHLSISDEMEYAIAFVVMEGEEIFSGSV